MGSLFNKLSRLTLALTVLGCVTWGAAAQAQTAGNDPTQAPRVDAGEGFGSADTNSNSLGGGLSPFDLIHRATLLNGTSMEDFSRQQRGHLSDEAAKFRMQQQEALQRQAAPQVPAPSGEVE